MNIVHLFLVLGILGLTVSSITNNSFGEKPSIVIPQLSKTDSSPTIDGVWTSTDEWSKSSETILNYTDGNQLVIRGEHDSDSLFVLLEMPKDTFLDGKAGICFDTRNDGGPYLKADDHCFVFGKNALSEYIGDGRTTLMQQTALEPTVMAQAGLSGEKSPYKTSHVSYEFKVPIDYLADSPSFGFYVTFDTRGENNYTYHYSWPDYTAASLRTVSPRDWGTLEISSEANGTTVPEFPIHIVVVIAASVGTIALLTRTGFFKSYRI